MTISKKSPTFVQSFWKLVKIPHEAIIFTKFHEDCTKIVDFLFMANIWMCVFFSYSDFSCCSALMRHMELWMWWNVEVWWITEDMHEGWNSDEDFAVQKLKLFKAILERNCFQTFIVPKLQSFIYITEHCGTYPAIIIFMEV